MQVNLRSTLCISGVFLYCFGHTKKQNLAPMSSQKYAILILKYQKIFKKGVRPFPRPLSLRGRRHPFPTP